MKELMGVVTWMNFEKKNANYLCRNKPLRIPLIALKRTLILIEKGINSLV